MRVRPPLAGAALILASACLNDRPVAPAGIDGALAVRVAAPDVVKQSVSVLVTYSPYNADVVPQADSVSPYQLFQHTYATASGTTRITANFSLAKCLSQFPPDALGPYCDVAVQLQLLSDSVVVDARTLAGVRVRPGVVTTTDSVTFGVAGAPPQLSGTPARGVLVDAPTHLVWYGVTGTDPNMDIIGAVALVIDSSGTASGTTTQYFTAPLGSVSIAGGPALYAVGPPRAMQYGAQLVDAQGNTSNTDSAGIDQPDAASAPFIFYASNTVSAGSIDVYAQWSAGAAPMKAVDFVVRTYTGVGVDTVFMVCTLAVPDQGGIVSGTCPRTGRPFTSALITAVPFDSAGHTGSGITCDLGESCGGSVVVPQRVRRR